MFFRREVSQILAEDRRDSGKRAVAGHGLRGIEPLTAPEPQRSLGPLVVAGVGADAAAGARLEVVREASIEPAVAALTNPSRGRDVRQQEVHDVVREVSVQRCVVAKIRDVVVHRVDHGVAETFDTDSLVDEAGRVRANAAVVGSALLDEDVEPWRRQHATDGPRDSLHIHRKGGEVRRLQSQGFDKAPPRVPDAPRVDVHQEMRIAGRAGFDLRGSEDEIEVRGAAVHGHPESALLIFRGLQEIIATGLEPVPHKGSPREDRLVGAGVVAPWTGDSVCAATLCARESHAAQHIRPFVDQRASLARDGARALAGRARTLAGQCRCQREQREADVLPHDVTLPHLIERVRAIGRGPFPTGARMGKSRGAPPPAIYQDHPFIGDTASRTTASPTASSFQSAAPDPPRSIQGA